MQPIFGVIFHFIGGFASGSFYIPFEKVRGWGWEKVNWGMVQVHCGLRKHLIID